MGLQVQTPTPSDIDIAQAVPCVPIAEIARRLDLTDDDYEPQGHVKAKVRCSPTSPTSHMHPYCTPEQSDAADRMQAPLPLGSQAAAATRRYPPLVLPAARPLNFPAGEAVGSRKAG